jgi:hypothetical protein
LECQRITAEQGRVLLPEPLTACHVVSELALAVVPLVLLSAGKSAQAGYLMKMSAWAKQL